MVNQKNSADQKVLINQEKVNTNKEQAKLLVHASEAIIDVIDICKSLEHAELEKTNRLVITELKDSQIEMLEDIKEVASQNVISVPSEINTLMQNQDLDSVLLSAEINEIIQKISKQKTLVNALKIKASNGNLKGLTDNLQSAIDMNLDILNDITYK